MDRTIMGQQSVTPTELAEATYQRAQEARHAKLMPVGRAGIPVPGDRVVFRATLDGKLLQQIGVAAGHAHVARQIPAAEVAAVGQQLHDALCRLYPQDDMIVLGRHKRARWHDTAAVYLPSGALYRIDLPREVAIPTSTLTEHGGHVNFAADSRHGSHPLPEGLRAWFDKAAQAKAEESAVRNLGLWPGKFKVREGRYPMWGEIAAAFPIIGAWLREQREAANA